jgi:hypothetical protein
MAYSYQYTEGLKQFNMVHIMLTITDSDGILPEIIAPVILDESQYTEESIKQLVDNIISNNTQDSTVTESI